MTSDLNDELKRLAQRLQESEERFGNLVENFPRGITIGTPEGRILEANQAIRALFGYTREEFQTLPITALYNDPKDRSRFLEEILNKGRVVDFEALLKRKDGSTFWGSITTCAQDIDGKTQFLTTIIDITAHKQADVYCNVGLEILKIFNKPGDLKALIQHIVGALKSRTGFDAVGIRLKNEDDFPYLVQSGFSNAFLKAENTLVTRDADDKICRDKDGKPCLECICGFVLSGKPVPANPHFSVGGSFWTNDSSRLIDLPPDQVPWFHHRNMCIAQGFASIALVPILHNGEAVGLIQINDRRKGCFTLDTIEMLEGVASHVGGVMVRRQVSEALAEEARNMGILLETALGREERIVELKEKVGQLEEELKKRGNSC